MSGGTSTLARAWALSRRDGRVLGFTDHDRDLDFDGILFRAETGMTAKALMQTTGLSTDNTEASGALSSAGLTEADIFAGRYDAAELRIWQVDWTSVTDRQLLFRGTLGEITRAGGAFRVELRGLSEPLSRGAGRVFGALCPVVLGDSACGFDLASPGYFDLCQITAVAESGALLTLPPLETHASGWFTAGRVRFLDGAAGGLTGLIKRDHNAGDARQIELWAAPGATPAPGDAIRLEAGCDKRFATCREKFANQVNFRGFPHIPGEDWLTLMPRGDGVNDGGRRR
ncbi:DUF2163 domain-containing protein [Pararhodobacter sp. SW119]|uniref:DUF2163 domain-containing protein n=1 Tax=Pararhodobacter sp. SW119 TaxID=2780075 RepID=UPI001ADEF11E